MYKPLRYPISRLLLPTLLIASLLRAENEFELPSLEEEVSLPGEGALRRYDGYVNGWEKRRSAWAKNKKKDRNAVVFLGDSITQGWGDAFRNRFPGMKLANRGIGGDTTRGMLIRLEEDVLSLDPKAIVLLMGTNDIGVGIDAEVIGRNFEKIVAAIKAHDRNVPIVLCRIFPSAAEKKRPVSAIQKANERLEAIVKGDRQITVLDTWTLFANEEGEARSDWFPDRLHLNDDGYEKWASALRPIFATLGLSETCPDRFRVEKGFRSLFNGKNLTGWGVRVTPPRTRPNPNKLVFVSHDKDIAFDGKKRSDDGRYAAINGRLVVTTPAEGRRIQQLWTTEEFGDDFELRLEFRATPNADSGVFLRKKQFQVRDYVLAGPYNDLESYRPQEWNEMVFTVRGTTATVSCNGQMIVDDFEIPETGPIGLEGDRGQIEYRRIRIKHLDE